MPILLFTNTFGQDKFTMYYLPLSAMTHHLSPKMVIHSSNTEISIQSRCFLDSLDVLLRNYPIVDMQTEELKLSARVVIRKLGLFKNNVVIIYRPYILYRKGKYYKYDKQLHSFIFRTFQSGEYIKFPME